MKLAHIPPTAYTPGKLEYYCFLRGGVGADYHQNPWFHRLPNGEIRAVWIAYDFDECSNDGVQLYSTSRDGGTTWSDPQVFLADRAGGVPFYIRFLTFRGSTDGLVIQSQFVMDEIEVDPKRRVATRGSDYLRSRGTIVVRRSSDGCRTTDHGTELPFAEVTGGAALPGVGFYGNVEDLLELESGRIVAAFVYLDPRRPEVNAGKQHFSAVCLTSDDRGRTWRRSNDIVADTPRGLMEPTIVETGPNRLYCLLRTKTGFLYETRSDDGGSTWSAPARSAVPSPESMPKMLKLSSGAVVLVWNNVSSPTQRPRYPLVAAVSDDGCRSWSPAKTIADESGTNQLSNHALVEADDGRILVGISHYRDVRPMSSDLDMAVLDEAWIRSP